MENFPINNAIVLNINFMNKKIFSYMNKQNKIINEKDIEFFIKNIFNNISKLTKKDIELFYIKSTNIYCIKYNKINNNKINNNNYNFYFLLF